MEQQKHLEESNKDSQPENKNEPSGEQIKSANEEKPDEDLSGKLFMVFAPYLYKQFEDKPHLAFPTFDEAVDNFFSRSEEQQIEIKKDQQVKNRIIILLKHW